MCTFLVFLVSLCLILPAWGDQDQDRDRILSFDSRVKVLASAGVAAPHWYGGLADGL